MRGGGSNRVIGPRTGIDKALQTRKEKESSACHIISFEHEQSCSSERYICNCSNISRALLSRFWTVSSVACFYLVLQCWISLECLTSASSASCIFYRYFRFVVAFCADWWPLHSNVHLSKTIGAGVVDQVERLDGGAVVQPVASVWQRGEGELTSSDEAFFVPSSLYNL